MPRQSWDFLEIGIDTIAQQVPCHAAHSFAVLDGLRYMSINGGSGRLSTGGFPKDIRFFLFEQI